MAKSIDESPEPLNIELTGKMITSVDPIQLGKGDFRNLTNHRYTDKGIRAIQGMTKINTSAIANPTIASMYQFRKEFPSENHLLAQGFSGSTAAIFDNTTPIPNQGNFSQVYAESAGAQVGEFYDAPDGAIVFGDAKQLLIWGGNESRVSGFFVANTNDVSSTVSTALDYTIAVSDDDTTTFATINSRFVHIASTRQLKGVKFYVGTANTNAVTPLAYYWGGTSWTACSSVVDGTAVGGNTLAQTGEISFTSTVGLANLRYFQNILLYWYLFDFNGVAATTTVIMSTLDTPWQPITNQWDGVPLGIASCQTGVANTLVNTVVSPQDIVQSTAAYPPWTLTDIIGTYTGITFSTNATYYYLIGSPVPMQNITVSATDDTTTGNAVSYWNGSAWAAVGGLVVTHNAGVSLVLAFNPTTGSANLQYINGILAYWYRWYFTGGAITPSGGMVITQENTSTVGALVDQTANVESQDFDPNAYSVPSGYYNTTYLNAQGFIAATNNIYCGFAAQQQGMMFTVGGIYNNTAVSTMTISYWNGSAWVPLSAYDTTSVSGCTLYKSGIVKWTPPSLQTEFPVSINNTFNFYYYQISFSSTLSNSNAIIAVDYIAGIPSPTYNASSTGSFNVNNFLFASMFQNRLVLCNNQNGKRNSILISAQNTNCVFNGSDSIEVDFGDDNGIVAAVPFFSRFSNNFFENLLVGKVDSIYIVDGTSPNQAGTDPFIPYKISDMYGVSAPQTMTTCDIGFASQAGQATRNIVLWQSSNNIVLWDGSTVYPIDNDISDVFDITSSLYIEPTMLAKSQASYDERNHEWHWFWASQGMTYLNMEYVFDVIRKKWFNVNRGAGNAIQCSVPVIDGNNNRYLYGATALGYVERLEYGMTFDGTSITASYFTGDIPIAGWAMTSRIRTMKPIFKQKNNTKNYLQLDYYGDNSNLPLATFQFRVNDPAHRTVEDNPSSTVGFKSNVASISQGDYTTHAFKVSMTTNNELICHEPIGIAILWREVREDIS